MSILVTGFGPFPGVPKNPCQTVLAFLESRRPTEILTHTLPVSYRRSIVELDTMIAERQPRCIVQLGVSAKTDLVKLEQFAYNIRDASIPDVDGEYCRAVPIRAGGLAVARQSTCDLQELQRQLLSRGYQTVLSTDPGKYVCNNIYWHTLDTYPKIPSVFVHIPMLNDSNQQTVCETCTELVLLLDTLYCTAV